MGQSYELPERALVVFLARGVPAAAMAQAGGVAVPPGPGGS